MCGNAFKGASIEAVELDSHRLGTMGQARGACMGAFLRNSQKPCPDVEMTITFEADELREMVGVIWH